MNVGHLFMTVYFISLYNFEKKQMTLDYHKSFGSYAFNKEDKRYYLDMRSHYSSLTLGYNHPALRSKDFLAEVSEVCAIKTALGHYGSDQYQNFLSIFTSFAVPEGFSFTHLCSTGSLAVETAIKTAWAHNKRKKVICFSGSFHGVNSFGNFLSTSSRLNGIPQADWIEKFGFNSTWQSYIEIHHEEISAVIIEPIQCTNGDHQVPKEIIQTLRELCTKYGIVLIFDEIQTGLSCGEVWYSSVIGIEPDIIVFGKKFQVSGIIVRDTIHADHDHLHVTYDGDLIDCIRCKYIIQAIKKEALLFFPGSLLERVKKIEGLKNVRGIHSLIAFDFDTKQERDAFKQRCYENGMLVNEAGEKTIRLRPSLAIKFYEEYDVEKVIRKSLIPPKNS